MGEGGAIARDPVGTATDFEFRATSLVVLATGSFQEVLVGRRQGATLLEAWELSESGPQGNKEGVPSIRVKIRARFWNWV